MIYITSKEVLTFIMAILIILGIRDIVPKIKSIKGEGVSTSRSRAILNVLLKCDYWFIWLPTFMTTYMYTVLTVSADIVDVEWYLCKIGLVFILSGLTFITFKWFIVDITVDYDLSFVNYSAYITLVCFIVLLVVVFSDFIDRIKFVV